MSPPERPPWLRPATAVLLGLAAILYCYPLGSLLQEFGDSAEYVLLAESLAAGKGFSNLHYPGGPPHTDYPPGFPALLVPILWIFGRSYAALKLVGIAASLGTLALLPALLRPRVGPALALLAAAALALSPHFLLSAHSIQPEPVFALLALAAVTTACRETPRPVAVGLLCAGAWYLRKVGILLFPAIAAAWLLDGVRARALGPAFRRALLFGAAGLLPVALWMLREHLTGRSIDHSTHITAAVTAAASAAPAVASPALHAPSGAIEWLHRHLTVYPLMLAQILLPAGAQGFLELPWLAWPPLAAVGLGLLRAVRLRATPLTAFVLAYAALFMVWPFLTQRFWVPLAPFLLACLAFALGAVKDRRLGAAMMGVVALSAVPATLPFAESIRRGEDRVPVYAVDYVRLLERLTPVVPRDAAIMAPEPRLMTLLTGHRGVWPGYPPDRPDRAIPSMLGAKVHFLIWDPTYLTYGGAKAVADPASAHPRCLQAVLTEGQAILYKLHPDCIPEASEPPAKLPR